MIGQSEFSDRRHYLIATDGACKGNPGRGGWGAIVQLREGSEVVHQQALAGRGPSVTTNNQMELTGPIEALPRLREPLPTIVVSDSNYVVRGISEWLPGWKANNWWGAGGPVKNQELWERLDGLCQGRDIRWVWQRGHAGHELNEMADQLANNAVAGLYVAGRAAIKACHPKWFW